MGLDERINEFMQPVTDAVAGFIFYAVPIAGADVPLIVAWLIAGGVFFTLYLRFINVRGFRHALDLVRGRYTDPSQPGEVTPFQALATAVSGTVGIGNIAGVAVAISLGGPGATLWLIIAGLLGMSTKFAECTLAVKYRHTNPDDSVSGGPMYYLQRGLELRNLPGVGKGLGMFYAAAMVFGCLGIGNMFQSNQAAAILIEVTGAEGSFFSDKAWLLGVFMAVAVAMVIVGGIRSIARVTSKLVPFMAVLYVLSALAIIGINAERLPAAIVQIWQGAFSPESVGGGMIGVMIIGFRRAVFSNEAGLGSAAIAHSAVQTDEPCTEGFVSLLEPFIDTVVICTMTALVIITTVYGSRAGRCRHQRHRDDQDGLREHALLVARAPFRRGGAVRFLDHDFVELLRPEGGHLPDRRETGGGDGIQAVLLRLRGPGLEHQSRRPDRSFGCDDLRGRDSQPAGAVPACARPEKRGALVSGTTRPLLDFVDARVHGLHVQRLLALLRHRSSSPTIRSRPFSSPRSSETSRPSALIARRFSTI